MNTEDTLLIKGGYILTMDPDVGDLPTGDVLIQGSRIVGVGKNIHAKSTREVEVIDARGKVVMPGLIDNHWHMWQGLIPGVSCDDTFGQYFARALDGLGASFTPDDAALGVTLSALAGLEAGKTTVVNWDHGALTPEHVVASILALKDCGIRAIEAYGPAANSKAWFNAEGGPLPEDVRKIFKEHTKPDGLIRLGLAIRGPEFSNMDRVQADVALARELGIPITMHAGIPGFFQKTNSVKLMEDAGLLGKDITFVHCNAMKVDDFRRIKKHGAHVSVSPEVEMQMGFGRSPLDAQLDAGLQPTVSVDVPTAIGADLLLQIRMVLQRQREQYQSDALAASGKPLESLPIKARDVLAYVTTNAAASLGMGDSIGSLQAGKLADLILIDMHGADTFLRSPEAAVVQAAHPGNITEVLVNGRIVKRNGELIAMGTAAKMRLHKRAAVANARLTRTKTNI